MTDPHAPPSTPRPPSPISGRTVRGVVTIVIAVIVLALVISGGLAARRRLDLLGALNPAREQSRVTHTMVVSRIQAVAKLVSTEATIRDVVDVENTRWWSTKRALLVVTGRVLAGIDLDSTATHPGAEVHIDDQAHRISVSIPSAEILGIEVLNVRTYDEHAGLLNPFRPADRDAIQQEVRAQLRRAAGEMGLVQKANQNAVTLLRTLLAQDGYTVDVTVRGAAPAPSPSG